MPRKFIIELDGSMMPPFQHHTVLSWAASITNYMRRGDVNELPPGVKSLHVRDSTDPAPVIKPAPKPKKEDVKS